MYYGVLIVALPFYYGRSRCSDERMILAKGDMDLSRVCMPTWEYNRTRRPQVFQSATSKNSHRRVIAVKNTFGPLLQERSKFSETRRFRCGIVLSCRVSQRRFFGGRRPINLHKLRRYSCMTAFKRDSRGIILNLQCPISNFQLSSLFARTFLLALHIHSSNDRSVGVV